MMFSVATTSLKFRRSKVGHVVGGYKPHHGLSPAEAKLVAGKKYITEFNACIYDCLIKDFMDCVNSGGVAVDITAGGATELHLFIPFMFMHPLDAKAADFVCRITLLLFYHSLLCVFT